MNHLANIFNARSRALELTVLGKILSLALIANKSCKDIYGSSRMNLAGSAKQSGD